MDTDIFGRLPAEISLVILQSLPSLACLYRLLCASPSAARLFTHHNVFVFDFVVKTTLTAELQTSIHTLNRILGIRELVCWASRIDILETAVLARLVQRVKSIRAYHLRDSSFRYQRPGFQFFPAGTSYQPVQDAYGPPSWTERYRVRRALWRNVQLITESALGHDNHMHIPNIHSGEEFFCVEQSLCDIFGDAWGVFFIAATSVKDCEALAAIRGPGRAALIALLRDVEAWPPSDDVLPCHDKYSGHPKHIPGDVVKHAAPGLEFLLVNDASPWSIITPLTSIRSGGFVAFSPIGLAIWDINRMVALELCPDPAHFCCDWLKARDWNDMCQGCIAKKHNQMYTWRSVMFSGIDKDRSLLEKEKVYDIEPGDMTYTSQWCLWTIHLAGRDFKKGFEV